MASLVLMCGLPFSGKSTRAEKLKQDDYRNRRCTILSIDKMRELFPTAREDTLYEKLIQKIDDIIKNDETVIVDEPNITFKQRKRILNGIHYEAYIKAFIMNTPYETCLERLRIYNEKNPNKQIVEATLRDAYEKFEIPFEGEGFNEININHSARPNCSDKYLSEMETIARNFNQDNKHHTQLLGDHMNTVAKYIYDNGNDYVLKQAGKYHDVGKIFTRSYKEGDKNAHYYNHANIGTYNLMCYCGLFDEQYDDRFYNHKKTLDWLFYINNHMKLHNDSSPDLKYYISNDKWHKLKLLYDADCYRPDDNTKEDDTTPKQEENPKNKIKFQTLTKNPAEIYKGPDYYVLDTPDEPSVGYWRPTPSVQWLYADDVPAIRVDDQVSIDRRTLADDYLNDLFGDETTV